MSCQGAAHVVQLLFVILRFFMRPYVFFNVAYSHPLISGREKHISSQCEQRNSGFLSCHFLRSFLSCLFASSPAIKKWNVYELVRGRWCFFSLNFQFLVYIAVKSRPLLRRSWTTKASIISQMTVWLCFAIALFLHGIQIRADALISHVLKQCFETLFYPSHCLQPCADSLPLKAVNAVGFQLILRHFHFPPLSTWMAARLCGL